MTLEDWTLIVGTAVGPFSRFGECKVQLETDFPDRFAGLDRVCARMPNGHAAILTVESSRLHKKQVLLKFEGVDSIEAAELLRGASIQVREQDAVPLEPGEFYIHQALGCDVVTAEGRLLGRLNSVMRGGGNDVFVIGEGRSEILLPVVRSVVRSVDLPGKRIVVTPTPGLLPESVESP